MTRFAPARHKCLIGLALALLSAAPACGGGGGGGSSDDSSTVTFEGEWDGTWAGLTPGPSGTVTLTLAPAGAALGGTAVFQGHPCISTCAVQCQVNGEKLLVAFSAGPLQMLFEGTCSGPHHGSGHQHHASAMTGTYVVHGGPCAGEGGSLELTRRPEGAPAAGAPEMVQVGEVILLEGDAAEPSRIPVYATVEPEP